MKQAPLFQLIRRAHLVWVASILVFCSASTVVLACSGDGTIALIEYNHFVVLLCAILSAILLVTSFGLFFLRGKKGFWVVVVALLLLIFHPVWRYGGGGGDCGVSMADGAQFSTVLIAVGALHQLRSWLIERGKRRM